MYYFQKCSYCYKIFYTYQDSREVAASVLYNGIKRHLIDYNEDHREYDFDDGPKIDTDEVYGKMIESNYPPAGGYQL